MKLVGKIVGLIVGFTLLLNPLLTNVSSANSNSLSFELSNGVVSDIKVEEDNSKRTVEYFENGVKLQIAEFYKETEEIYFYDLKEQSNNIHSDNLSINNTLEYTAKYRLDDFRSVKEMNISNNENNISLGSINPTASYSLVKSLFYKDGNKQFSRYLYGAQFEKQYERNSWHFAGGIAFSVVIAIVGLLPGVNALILAAVGVSGGVILSALTVSEWIKDSYWKYEFLQTSPDYMSFVSPQEFVYKRENRVQVNGDIGYWETFETQPASQTDFIRTNILQYPGLYMH